MSVPLSHALALCVLLWALGLACVLVRRNLLFVLIGLEVMLNAAALAWVVAGSRWLAPDGQILFILALSLAACEVAVGLALVLAVHRRYGGLDIDLLSELRR